MGLWLTYSHCIKVRGDPTVNSNPNGLRIRAVGELSALSPTRKTVESWCDALPPNKASTGTCEVSSV
jgi:hypothetical protein